MSSKIHSRFKAAMESFPESEELPPSVETEEVGPIDLETHEVQIQSAEADILQVGNDAVSVENLIQAIRASTEGLSPVSYGFVNTQCQRLQERYGISRNLMLPSMECFEQNRLAVTEVSMETLKEIAGKVWEWIKAMYEKFKKIIQDFFRHLNHNFDLLNEKANTLKDQVRRKKFASSDVLKNGGGLLSELTDNRETKTDFTSTTNNLITLTRVSEESFARVSSNAVKDFKRVMSGEGRGTVRDDYFVPQGFGPAGRSWREGYASRNSDGYDEAALSSDYGSPIFPGGHAVLLSIFTNAKDRKDVDSDVQQEARVRRVKLSHMVTKPTIKHLPQLSSEDVFTLCQRISKVIAAIRTSRSALDTHMDKVAKELEAVAVAHKGEQGSVDAKRYCRTAVTFGPQLFQACDSVAYLVLRNYLNWGLKSAAQGWGGLTEEVAK